MRYELFYLIGASREADMDKTREEVKKIIAENGGEFSEKETQEKRRLAYKIKHETHGIYIAQRFEIAEPDNIKDINGKLNLNAGVLRFVISRADELPELKSKEERINEAADRDSRNREIEKRTEEKKGRTEKSAKGGFASGGKAAPAKIKQDKSVTSDDIDKKLEEILNI